MTGQTSPTGQDALVRVSGLGKTYRSTTGVETTALTGVDFGVAAGEFVSIVGPSGCGKTTLMKITAGLISPTVGTVDYRGTGGPVRPGTYGMVFQGPALLPWHTVEENIMLPARILGLDMAWARDRVPDLLELVRLGGQGTKYPRELSGGMQQRVAIARALLPDPEVLFMDEPFGALDAMTREELNMSLQAVHLAERKTVVFVTHSISEAVLLSDRVIVMSARPGAVIDQVAIPSDRPRDMVNLGEPRFHEAQVRIREGLSGAVDSQRSNP